MSRRSRLWWAAALIVSIAGAGYELDLLPGLSTVMYGGSFCLGADVMWEYNLLVWSVSRWVPLVWFSGVPAVVIAFLAHWLSTRYGRPRAGRVIGRVMAGAVLVVYGRKPLLFAVDLVIDRGCVERWGSLDGLVFILDDELPPTLAALCVLAAVRIPRHRVRRLLCARWFRRAAAVTAACAPLSFLPVADLGSGRITPADGCEPDSDDGIDRGELAFLCGARGGGRYANVPDHTVLAYGRAQCRAYPGGKVDPAFVAPICPPAAADIQASIDEEERDYQRREAEIQAVCDRRRHRPLIKPVRVVRERMWPEIGLQAYEDSAESADPNTPPDGDGIVTSATGSLWIFAPRGDNQICLIAETYRRRPPVEVKGWDEVMEVGYLSPTGELVLVDPLGGSLLPNLAFLGKGHYRVRVHYREPEGEDDPQDFLIMVYPGKSDKVLKHLPGNP